MDEGKMGTMRDRRHRQVGPLAGLLLLVALVALWEPALLGATALSDTPPHDFSLADQGYSEQTVRGSSATLDMYFPGPGRFQFGDGNVFTLALSHAEVLDPLVS